MKTDKANKKFSRGIKSRIVWCFLALILASLILLALCQLFLFDGIYTQVRVSELKKATHKALSITKGSGIYMALEELSDEYSLCIRVATTDGVLLHESECQNDCTLHAFSSSELAYLTSRSKNDPTYLEIESNGSKYTCYIFDNPLVISIGDSVLSMFRTSYKGNDIVVLLSTLIELSPSTSDAFMIMLISVMVVIALLAVITAVILSKTVASPLVRISRAATQLSKGAYTPQKGGYKEIDELNDTLFTASEELSKTEKLRRELIANVSHDLRTPLTLIKGCGEIMRDIPGEMNEENLATIISEADRLSLLVSDMLDLSKLESGTYSLSLQNYNLTEALKADVMSYQSLVSKNGFDIELICDGDLFVNADRTLISEALFNLLANAVKHTGANRRIRVKEIICADSVRVEVADTGNGIPPERLVGIWERYGKSSENFERSGTGSGLGLSIVKNIITLHGGNYGVRSAVSKGSVFWFEIPRVK